MPNPRLSLVREGIALAKASGVDFVLAVGGGSVNRFGQSDCGGLCSTMAMCGIFIHGRRRWPRRCRWVLC